MIAERAKKITPFLVMDVLERAHAIERDGANVIHLEVGEPDFDTPQCVKAAVCKALEDGRQAKLLETGDARLDVAHGNRRHALAQEGVDPKAPHTFFLEREVGLVVGVE